MAGAGRPRLAGVLKQKMEQIVCIFTLSRSRTDLPAPHDMSHLAVQKSAVWELCKAW